MRLLLEPEGREHSGNRDPRLAPAKERRERLLPEAEGRQHVRGRAPRLAQAQNKGEEPLWHLHGRQELFLVMSSHAELELQWLLCSSSCFFLHYVPHCHLESPCGGVHNRAKITVGYLGHYSMHIFIPHHLELPLSGKVSNIISRAGISADHSLRRMSWLPQPPISWCGTSSHTPEDWSIFNF